MESSLIGSRLGKYEIKAELGRGGMGTVYLGYDPLLDRQVAVKVLAPHLVWNEEFVQRFLREARAAARLKHPHIVTIYEVGQEAGWYYFAMEHLEGETLATRLQRQGALPTPETLAILRPLATALDYAHYRGIVHRDVKPGNVIIGHEGQVTLMDFGIARAAQEGRLTSTGTVVGTPEYMSPEQARGLSVESRTDQYSLGVVAYQMLTGHVPFQADSTLALMYKIVHEPPPPLAQYRPDLPAGVGAALDRALTKEPGGRYPTVSDFVEALAQALAGEAVETAAVPRPEAEAQETLAVPPPIMPRTMPARPFGARRAPLLACGVAGLTVLAAATCLAAFFVVRPLVRAPNTAMAFVSDRDGPPQLYVLDGKGTITRLTRHTADAVDPAWSPDKTRIAFASTLDGNWEIYWMKADGSGLTRVTDNPARDAEPT